MSYEQDKHKLRKLYEQNIQQEQDLAKLNAPIIRPKPKNLLRKINPLAKTTEFADIRKATAISVPTISGLDGNYDSSTNPPTIALRNLKSLFIFDATLIVDFEINGVSYAHRTIPPTGNQFDPRWRLPFQDRDNFDYNSSYTIRIRNYDENLKRFGVWSNTFSFQTFPYFEFPMNTYSTYAYVYKTGGSAALPIGTWTPYFDGYYPGSPPRWVTPTLATITSGEMTFVIDSDGTNTATVDGREVPAEVTNDGPYVLMYLNFNNNAKGIGYKYDSLKDKYTLHLVKNIIQQVEVGGGLMIPTKTFTFENDSYPLPDIKTVATRGTGTWSLSGKGGISGSASWVDPPDPATPSGYHKVGEFISQGSFSVTLDLFTTIVLGSINATNPHPTFSYQGQNFGILQRYFYNVETGACLFDNPTYTPQRIINGWFQISTSMNGACSNGGSFSISPFTCGLSFTQKPWNTFACYTTYPELIQ